LSTLRRPSAFLPVAMSLAALAVLAFYVLINGTARQDAGSTLRVSLDFVLATSA